MSLFGFNYEKRLLKSVIGLYKFKAIDHSFTVKIANPGTNCGIFLSYSYGSSCIISYTENLNSQEDSNTIDIIKLVWSNSSNSIKYNNKFNSDKKFDTIKYLSRIVEKEYLKEKEKSFEKCNAVLEILKNFK